MSSTTTDDQPDKPGELQSGAFLGQHHSAVSPLLDNIIGGAARFVDKASDNASDNASSEALPANSDEPSENALPDPSHADAAEPETAMDLSSNPPDNPPALPLESAASATAPQQQLGPDYESESLETSPERCRPSPPEQLSLSEQYGDAGLLAELNALTQTQQFHLEQHREYLLRSRAEQEKQIENWQLRCAALEAQLQELRDRTALLEQRHLASQAQVIPLEAQRDAAQQLTERLQAEILDRRQDQAVLEEQLDLAEATLREQQEITAAQSRGIVSMQAELSQAEAEVAALETRLSHQDQLRQQLKADGSRDRQDRSQARDRQLQLEQETTQMTGQLLRLSEELRQTQRQSIQWRRQAQAQAEQLRDITQWAAQAEALPPELMALLEPVFNSPELDRPELDRLEFDRPELGSSELDNPELKQLELNNPGTVPDLPGSPAPEKSKTPPTVERDASATSHPTSLDLPNFPHGPG